MLRISSAFEIGVSYMLKEFNFIKILVTSVTNVFGSRKT